MARCCLDGVFTLKRNLATFGRTPKENLRRDRIFAARVAVVLRLGVALRLRVPGSAQPTSKIIDSHKKFL